MKKIITLPLLLLSTSFIYGMDYPDEDISKLIDPMPVYMLDAIIHSKLVKCDVCNKVINPTNAIPHAFQEHLPILKQMLHQASQPKETIAKSNETIAECETCKQLMIEGVRHRCQTK